MTGPAAVADGLRSWAAGMYETEAAVELLLRVSAGRFASPGCPWVQQSKAGVVWLDAERMTGRIGHLSGGEQRVLAVVQALATGGPLWNLGGVLAGVERPELALILAGLAHAGGSHEQVDVTVTGSGLAYRRLPALVEWPEVEPVGAVW